MCIFFLGKVPLPPFNKILSPPRTIPRHVNEQAGREKNELFLERVNVSVRNTQSKKHSQRNRQKTNKHKPFKKKTKTKQNNYYLNKIEVILRFDTVRQGFPVNKL